MKQHVSQLLVYNKGLKPIGGSYSDRLKKKKKEVTRSITESLWGITCSQSCARFSPRGIQRHSSWKFLDSLASPLPRSHPYQDFTPLRIWLGGISGRDRSIPRCISKTSESEVEAPLTPRETDTQHLRIESGERNVMKSKSRSSIPPNLAFSGQDVMPPHPLGPVALGCSENASKWRDFPSAIHDHSMPIERGKSEIVSNLIADGSYCC